ncbi:MAG: hypothetical protein R3A45_06160 [Bdellovibrionota bacterium]
MTQKNIQQKILFIAVMLFCIQCASQNPLGNGATGGGSGGTSTTQQSLVDVYFDSSITTLAIDVFYESGAQPYTGNIGLFGDTWSYTSESIDALFSEIPTRSVEVPTVLAQMTQISTQNKESWSIEDLNNLADAIFVYQQTANKVNVGIIFVKGAYAESTSILGVHPSGKPYVFIFKDIITSLGGTNQSQKQTEQAVVVHEIGHALGLVNNGVEMVDDHEDGQHPKHTQNNTCVMYWAVENKLNITDFVSGMFDQPGNLFQEEVLNDAHAYKP